MSADTAYNWRVRLDHWRMESDVLHRRAAGLQRSRDPAPVADAGVERAHAREPRSAARTRSTSTRSPADAAADLFRLLQRAVLRHRRAVPALQLRVGHRTRSHSTVGSSFPSAWRVSAASPRSTARWAACPGSGQQHGAADSRHGRGGFRRQPPARPAGFGFTSGRRVAPARRYPGTAGGTSLGSRRSSRSRCRQRIDERSCALQRSITAPAPHTSGEPWEQTETTFAANVRGTHYLFDALRSGRDRDAAC